MSKSLFDSINLGYEIQKEAPPLQSHIDFIEGDSVITTMNTGFIHNDKPVVPHKPELNCRPSKRKNPDSIINNIDTGFGCDNVAVIQCPKPKYNTHLCKENYFGEFVSETEKALARYNLGVYSKEELDKIVGDIIIDNSKEFTTKKEVQEMIANLDFVDSKLKANADYEIPDKLFKL